MRRTWICAAGTGVVLLACVPAARAQEGTWALTNARIETVTHGVIDRGTIVIRDGLIEAVGADVTPPADARVVNLTGRTVFPGIIDLTSSLGLPAAPAPGAGGGGGPPQASGANQNAGRAFVGLEPERMVADELRPTAADIKTARDAGITAVLSAPVRGAFRGQSALVPLRDSVTTREVIRSPVGLHLGYQGIGFGFGGNRYPGTLLGVIAYERQHFYDARRQAQLEQRYAANPRGMERPPHDAALDALIPAVRGDMPVFFAANNENEIRRAIGIAREFNLKLTVVGATEGFRALDALRAARRPVVVSVDYPRSSDVTGWAYRGAQRLPPNDSAAADSAGRRVIEGNPAALMQAGITFALASGGKPSDFLSNVRKAIAAGLPRDSALAAITMRPAEIAGVGDQLGSIETGKVANLVVTEGDLLGDSAKIRMVFVDGIRYTIDPPAAPQGGGPGGRGNFRGRGGPNGGGAPPIDAAALTGTWDLAVTSPNGENQVTVVMQAAGTSFTGNVTSQLGTSDIQRGTINGAHLSWNTSAPVNGQDVSFAFNADVANGRMTGTIDGGQLGNFSFTGVKRP